MAKTKETAVAAIPPLVITPDKGLPIDGNFAQILGYLKLRGKEVAKMRLTEDSLDKAKLIKREAAAYRKGVEEKLKTTVELLFDGPKAVLKSRVQDLFDAIDQIEQTAASVLDKVEERRVADLNKAYAAYQEEFQRLYRLSDDRLAQVELRKWYYNKTPADNEKKAKLDMEQQFMQLKKRQDDYASDVRMIQTLCGEDQRLSVQLYIDMLEHSSVSAIAGRVAVEKQRLAALDTAQAEPEEAPADEPEPEAAQADTEEGFPEQMSEKALVVRYPQRHAEQVALFVKELKKLGVIVKELKPGETYFAAKEAA
jgi:hypothetical protein